MATNIHDKEQIRICVDTKAQAASQIPFHLRSKVEAGLENLPSQGITEKVSGPTPCLSIIIVATKPHDKVSGPTPCLSIIIVATKAHDKRAN